MSKRRSRGLQKRISLASHLCERLSTAVEHTKDKDSWKRNDVLMHETEWEFKKKDTAKWRPVILPHHVNHKPHILRLKAATFSLAIVPDDIPLFSYRNSIHPRDESRGFFRRNCTRDKKMSTSFWCSCDTQFIFPNYHNNNVNITVRTSGATNGEITADSNR